MADTVSQPRGNWTTRLATAALAMFLAASFASSAPAFELFGKTLWGEREGAEPPSPDATPYEVTLTVSGLEDDDLEERLRDASSLVSDQEKVPQSPMVLTARGRDDYARITAALYAAGYYGGVIRITVDGRAVERLAPDAVLPSSPQVAIEVEPGERFRFGRVDIENRPPDAIPGKAVPKDPAELGLQSGKPAFSGLVLSSETALVGRWRYLGHPKAVVSARDVTAHHRDGTLDVRMKVEPGPQATFGRVTASGTERMNADFVAWYSGLEPGTTFDPDALNRAKAQMRRLEVFKSARLVEAEAIEADGSLPIDIQVAERPRRAFGVGASYYTIDGAGLEGYWQHRNLFGKAEKLRVEGRVSGIGSTDPEDFNFLAATTFTKPGVFTPYTDFRARIFAEQESPDTYLERSTGGSLVLSHRYSEQLEVSGGVAGAWSQTEDAFGKRDTLIASLPATLEYDTRDNKLNPTEGVHVLASASPFHEFKFANSGVLSRVRGSAYYGFGPTNRFVLAGRATVGSLVGARAREMPASWLFYAGGGDSVRGYAYRNIGPRRANGDVVGGRSYFDSSLELRAQVTDTIGIVPFIDAGAAFASTTPDFSEELKFGAGVGLRYNTGLGPLRVDVAVPVNPEIGDPSFGVYIGLGQAF